MLLFFLKIRLLTFLFFFTCDILGFYLKKIQSFLLSVAFLLLIFCGMMINVLVTQRSVKQDEIISVSLKNAVEQKEVLLTKQEVENKISEYETVLQRQPQHRDVLINTSLLYQALTEQKKAHQFWEQARELDPNNPLFKTN